MNTLIIILIGIVLGWFIPRPWFIGPIEEKLLGPIKSKVPEKYKWW
jgi:hypothetical protein|tara:strand:+ start:693 stop:830 length:138 start_codon:yes stop_codon:yes gene_type:complete